jgi:hypothetical protein
MTLDEFIGNLVVLRDTYGGDLQVEMDDGTQATCEYFDENEDEDPCILIA